jgi:hypothetical protein
MVKKPPSTSVKKRKNPWHKRRVNERYRELCEKIGQDPEVLSKFHATRKMADDLKRSTDTILDLRRRRDEIMTRKILGDPFQGLPIETLEDLYQMQKDGYTSKPSFKDLIRANELKKQGDSIIESQYLLATEAKVSQIDLIMAQIEALLKDTEEE